MTSELRDAQVETVAQQIYRDETANDPVIHCNRFPAWSELPEPAKRPYRDRAIAALSSLSSLPDERERIVAYLRIPRGAMQHIANGLADAIERGEHQTTPEQEEGR